MGHARESERKTDKLASAESAEALTTEHDSGGTDWPIHTVEQVSPSGDRSRIQRLQTDYRDQAIGNDARRDAIQRAT